MSLRTIRALTLLGGSIAVAQAPPPPLADREVQVELGRLQPKIERAIDRGIDWLLDTQLRDGTWGHEQTRYATGQTALCCFTLLKSGLPPDHPAVRRALLAMARVRPGETYGAGCHLLALAATKDPQHVPRMQQIVDDLLSWQDGTWGYPLTHAGAGWSSVRSRPDLSCTQYAALGLRAAALTGIEVPHSAWLDLIDEALRYQNRPETIEVPIEAERTGTGKQEIAGFRYVLAKGGAATGSMTAAGIAVLRIAAEALGEHLPGEEAREIDRACELALGWLAHNFRVHENPGNPPWAYYYLYGIERVGALLQRERIGAHPWYLLGAQQLLEWQQRDGHWAWSRAQPDTCFALLFLQRATAPATGGSGRKPHLHIAERKAAAVHFRVAGGTDGTPLRMSLTGFGDSVWASHGSGTAAARRWPAVARVEWRIDGCTVATLPGDAGRPWTHAAFPAQHEVTRRGRFVVSARVLVKPEDASEPVPLVSDDLSIDVQQVFSPWMADAISASERNLLAEQVLRASSSTQHAVEFGPAMAVDGLQDSRWLSADGDAEPSLILELPRLLRAGKLVLGQANAELGRLGIYDRITRVRIKVNDSKQPIEAELDPDELAPTVILLDRGRPIRRLEIRVVGRVAGGRHKGLCGFAEVALED